MKLNGRWFPQIVDRDSGNLYPIYPPFPCYDFLSQGWWGGVGGGGVDVFLLNIFFRKTIVSHFMFFISRGAEGPGREILQRTGGGPSVCLCVRLSVTFSFCTVTQKRIDIFCRNFAGTCTMSWGCAV